MSFKINVLILLGVILHFTISHKNRSILYNEFKGKTKSLKDIEVWKNKLKDDFIDHLQKMAESVKKTIIGNADLELKNKWEPILAIDYLGYKLNGSRNNYEGNRRSRLQTFILAEMLTNSGKYLKEIANGLWLMLEESTWVWPAHLSLQSSGLGLPDPKQYVVDLGVGETSAYTSWVKLLVGDKLNTYSPIFVKRIEYELDKRLVKAYMSRDYWWTGLKGQKVNNWNVWINSNILTTCLLDLNDPKRLEVIQWTVKSADDWLNWYGNDGGCDEGPAYWGEAGGRFIQYIYYLSSASNHQMVWSSDPLIKNIGSYIYKMHIDGHYFVNFADSRPTLLPEPSDIYNYAHLLNDSLMLGFAAYFAKNVDYRLGHVSNSGHLQQFYLQMISYNKLRGVAKKAPQLLEAWLPELQVVTLRSEEGSAKGLFLGAKAGHNDESHNHNDVGNFIIYVNGLPAIIDIGQGTYNSKTFSKHRYEIWNMQSQWHNTPTINGVQQHHGEPYKAKNVKFAKVADGAQFEADIAGAYPKEAHVKTWQRKLTFHRKTNTIDLAEHYVLDKFVKAFEIHFITFLKVSNDINKEQIVFKGENTTLFLNYKSDAFEIKMDDHKCVDSRISGSWGERIYRLTLVSKHNTLKGDHSFSFHL